jgi:hypothetical protein
VIIGAAIPDVENPVNLISTMWVASQEPVVFSWKELSFARHLHMQQDTTFSAGDG